MSTVTVVMEPDWHEKLEGTGFAVQSIPSFYLVRDDGHPTGKMLDGDRWGRNTPDNMAAALRTLLGR